jgi:hypothetical protein
MCELCEIKNESQLQFAFDLLDQVWYECPRDRRWTLRRYLIDAIEEYEDRHVEISELKLKDRVAFAYDQRGWMGALRCIGEYVLEQLSSKDGAIEKW